MDDMHNPNDIDSQDPNQRPAVAEASPEKVATKQARPRFKQSAILVAALLVGIGAGAIGMYLYKNSDSDSTNKSTVQKNQTESGSTQQTGIAKDDTDIESEPASTDDRPLYTEPGSKYSFRYAKSWSLSRETERNPYNQGDPTEYEKITLKKDDKAIVILDYPFEMTGCGPSSETLPYEFGDYYAKMTDPCGGVPEFAGEQYMVMFDNPKQKPSGFTDKEWPMLRLRYYTGIGGKEGFVEFREFARSIKGLVPAEGYKE